MTRSTRRILLAALIAALVFAAIGMALWPRPPVISVDYKMPGNPREKIDAAAAAAIERREKVIDQTIWAKEMIAEEHGRVFEDFWDWINAATNEIGVAKLLLFDQLQLPQSNSVEKLPDEIEWLHPTGPGKTLSRSDFASFIENFSDAGWRLLQTEFRHNAFDPQTNDIPARSRFYFSAHLTNALTPARAAIEGDLMVEWRARETNQPPKIARIDATHLEIKTRTGPPAFVPILAEAFDAPNLSSYIEPLIVYDLDGDGIPEIILPALNCLYRRSGESYRLESLFPKQNNRLQINDGLFADFDGDGMADFLFINFEGIFLLKGSNGGKFEEKPRGLTGPLADFSGPTTLAVGDIDGDGDLDVFVGQYKGPFINGSLPTPYYDANDGYPSYLFLNDGHGNLKDATVAAGLAAKRFRRIYGASFVDLDGDGALDLLVTSDFAGSDVYRGDGRGHFQDVTSDWLPESHAFGMAHIFADFNNDGRVDFLVAGMNSPAAERLEHLGLNRPYSKLDRAMRAKMIYGSRLFLGSEGGGFVCNQLGNSIARTGWSWGVAAADFDNDGWEDVYVANGMESRETVRDYDPEFWLHDLFVADSRDSQAAHAYLYIKGGATRGKGMSYGGYDKNRLYLNRAGRSFVDLAHLLGVASEEDCRNLVAADLDGDGKVDLAFTTVEVKPPYKQRLHVFKNNLPDVGNWIGFQFREEPGTTSPIGARVTLCAGNQTRVQELVVGDSFRSQHPLVVRFGIGKADSVDSVEIKWPGGEVIHIARPEINRLNFVKKPAP